MSNLERVRNVVLSNKAKTLYATTIALTLTLAIAYIGYRRVGIIDTIVYLTVFGLAATIIPLSIAVAGHAMPGNVTLGKLHIILSALSYRYPYLVQTTNGWEWCPGTPDEYYLNNEWHSVPHGHENRSRLGWRPFGILRHRDQDAYTRVRSDAEADTLENRPEPNGGTPTKGGFTRKRKQIAQQLDADWIVNLDRVYTRGVKKIADTSLIETAEQIIERGEVNDSFVQENRPMITFLVSLTLGILTGFMYVYLLA